MYIASHMNYENHLQEILCNFLYVNKLGIGGDDLKTQFLHNWMVTMYMAMLQFMKLLPFTKQGNVPLIEEHCPSYGRDH